MSRGQKPKKKVSQREETPSKGVKKRSTVIKVGNYISDKPPVKMSLKKSPYKYTYGQPTKYQPKFCQEIIEFMSQGFSAEAFAGYVCVSSDTIYEWAKVHPEFSEAKRIGIEQCRIYWENIGRKHIINKTDKTKRGFDEDMKARSLNTGVWCFNMSNRFNWRNVDAKEKAETPVEDKTFKLAYDPKEEPKK